MDSPLIGPGDTPPDEPVLGYPAKQQALLPKKLSTEGPDESKTCGPWASCATMCGFVAFAVLVVGVLPTVLNSLSGTSSFLGRSEGCSSGPWGGAAAHMLPGNETCFSDPVWQKWQASQLLSALGFASGRRTFVAMAGAHRTCNSCCSHCACPGAQGCFGERISWHACIEGPWRQL